MTDVSPEAAPHPSSTNSIAVLADVVRRADDVVNAAELAAQNAIRCARQAAQARTDEAVRQLERIREESDQLEAIAIAVMKSAHSDADAMITSARCEAAIVVDDAHQRSYEITESALQTAADLHETSHVASEELLTAAQAEAEEILARARENAHRIIQDANAQATGIDERQRSSASFSAMWDSAHEGTEIEDFFAGMSERQAEEVFKR